MRFASLGSGSRGNATLIEAGGTCLMLDCGFSCTETERRLARLGLAPDRVSAILVTHEHGDHANGVAAFARRHGTPVWFTPGTAVAMRDAAVPAANHLNSHRPFRLGDIEVRPFPVPHDAREPCQFVFAAHRRRLGILTDAGSLTSHMLESLAGCDALVLECNHDEQMLRNGPYPDSLKRRVGGRLGHLSNRQAAGLLERLGADRLQHLVAAHLSEKNNAEALVRTALAEAGRISPDWIRIADQDAGLDWCEIRD